MRNIYISNAFSLQMVKELPANIKISEIAKNEFEEYKKTAVSVVGHADTAVVLGVEFNRVNITLDKGDVLMVGQIVGGRLPEGATTLPEGFSFKFLKVEIN